MKILKANVGNFVSDVLQQIRAGATTLNGMGISIKQGDIDVKFAAEVIQTPQSLQEVTQTQNVDPETTRVTTEAAYVQTTEENSSEATRTTTEQPSTQSTQESSQEVPSSEVTTRQSTNQQSTGGGDTDDTTYSWKNYT